MQPFRKSTVKPPPPRRRRPRRRSAAAIADQNRADVAAENLDAELIPVEEKGRKDEEYVYTEHQEDELQPEPPVELDDATAAAEERQALYHVAALLRLREDNAFRGPTLGSPEDPDYFDDVDYAEDEETKDHAPVCEHAG